MIVFTFKLDSKKLVDNFTYAVKEARSSILYSLFVFFFKHYYLQLFHIFNLLCKTLLYDHILLVKNWTLIFLFYLVSKLY